MMTPDVNVVLLDLDYRTNEAVVENEDGSFTIVINARLSCDARLKAYQHAMGHIEHNDFEKANVQEIEYFAHKNEQPAPEPARRASLFVWKGFIIE